MLSVPIAHCLRGSDSHIISSHLRRESAHFQQTRTAIIALVAADFVAAREYAAVFEEHRKVFEFTCSWSFEQYTAKKRCEWSQCVIMCSLPFWVQPPSEGLVCTSILVLSACCGFDSAGPGVHHKGW